MPGPTFAIDDNTAEVDSIFDEADNAFLKPGGRTIASTGPSSYDYKPQLVEDATKLILHGGQVVAAGPTRTKLRASSTPCKRVTIKALVGNSNTLYVGTSTVTADVVNTTGGFQLSPGEAFTFGCDDLTDIYIHGTAGEGCSFAGEE